MTPAVLLLGALLTGVTGSGTRVGYYRQPSTDGRLLVFVAEGDLWRVPIEGGLARRLTTHPGQESHPRLSADGQRVAFCGEYEGSLDVYLMPAEGGLPRRLTYHGDAVATGWTRDGRVLYRTRHFSTLPDWQLVRVDPETLERERLPLAQAIDGAYDERGRTLYFTRLPFQGSSTKRYKGGTAQNLWRLRRAAEEAEPLTADYPGTSKAPMWHDGRVYFASDRGGSMNLWRIEPDGSDAVQLTHHRSWDIQGPSYGGGVIVYQLGADLRAYDIASAEERTIDIQLASDFDQRRERWVHEPMRYLTAAHLNRDGSRVALTARGQVFVAPVTAGRLVEVTRDTAIRNRDARFLPGGDAKTRFDDESLVTLSDQTGELEFWRLPATGLGAPSQLTRDGKIFRYGGVPSADGTRLAFTDKGLELWWLDIPKKKTTRISASREDAQADLSWSPDSRWLAYVERAHNGYLQLWLYDGRQQRKIPITSDRVNSFSPAWGPDGELLYFLSERHLVSKVSGPWGPRQPEPFLDETTEIYVLPLHAGGRSPFLPPDELHPAPDAKDDAKHDDGDGDKKSKDDDARGDEPPPPVEIEFDGLAGRIAKVPVPPGNYDDLSVTADRLFFVRWDTAAEPQLDLVSVPIADGTAEKVETAELFAKIEDYELSLDREHLLVRQKEKIYVVPPDAKPPEEPERNEVKLDGWRFSFAPRDEWRQMFVEAWRLERDYFYDRKMHGVDWQGVLFRYLPLVERITERGELNDLLHQMVGELSALHTFVFGGDVREGEDDVEAASLGARWQRDSKAGGYRIEHIYRADPDYIDERSPLLAPGIDVHDGDVIERIDGALTLSVPDALALLRDRDGRQVRLSVRPRGTHRSRDVIVEPLASEEAESLRYASWEESRRRRVESRGGGKLGYVHLRNLGGGDFTSWARNFYPVFDRQGLIVDVRHNGGGNIDSWILSRLMRKAWFYWSHPVANPVWNMRYAFRGHMIVLCDEFTSSDGEAFAEGFRRLGLGEVLGTRTWGGEIWLSFDNWLVDKGIATAAEYGVYGPGGIWLIEGHGVDPDVVVDNLPVATFNGRDAQLDAAIARLLEKIAADPRPVPEPPAYPIKAPAPSP